MPGKPRRGYDEEPLSYQRQKFFEKYLPERLAGKGKQPINPAVTLLLGLTACVFLFVCSIPILIVIRSMFQ